MKLVATMTWGADTQSYYGLARVELTFLEELLKVFVREKGELEGLLKQ